MTLFSLIPFDSLFLPGLPSGYSGPRITASAASHMIGAEGTVVLQELDGDGFQLKFWLFQLAQQLKLRFTFVEGIHSLFIGMGEGALQTQKGHYRLRPSQYILLPPEPGIYSLEPKKGKLVHLLQVSFSSSFLQNVAPVFPDTLNNLDFFPTKIPAVFFATPALRDTVHALLHADYEPIRVPFYFKLKLTEYLFHQLDQVYQPHQSEMVATKWELEGVQKVYNWILDDLQKHHKIKELAARVKIDRFRLQVLFRQVFGHSPYEILLRARMDKVRHLMEEGMPMKEAAPLAGYAHTTSFISAFTKRYGYSPGAIFRNRKLKS